MAETKTSTADMVFGQSLKLPADFFQQHDAHKDNNISSFLHNLYEHMRKLKPIPIKHHSKRSLFVHPELHSTSHVFIRHDGHRSPLQPVYDGPYKVLARTEKYFIIDTPHGVHKTISIDRLKPAFTLNIDQDCTTTTATPTSTSTNTQESSSSQPIRPSQVQPTNKTKSGRVVRFPKHLQDYEEFR
ncbi:hypothetical protein RI129_011375 [Pyrocoelia pectoralis]|uniref:Uncharacterized protein n=1 Tax=Pyrocoelia pectoralis TaxID=417401 RepID=A0AAN7VBW4_9COLE